MTLNLDTIHDNRKIRDKYNEMSSKMYDIEFGILQGSMLDPVLFIIYINDISDNINNNIKYIFMQIK